jgi:PAS domain-containing protein
MNSPFNPSKITGQNQPEQRFEAIFESSAIDIGPLALDGKILRVNQATCEISGYNAEELKGRYDQQNVYPPDRDVDLRLYLETRLDLELITEARDMQHVLAQVEDSHPDVVILDWELPGRPMGGRISVLRALVPGLKVIIINTRPESKERALADGADAFVCKSDPFEKLLEALSALRLEENKIP